MYPNRFKIIVTVLLLAVNFMSCNKNDFLPDLEGNIVGYVYSFDEFSQLKDNQSGVTITAIGVNGKYFTGSDENGRFEFWSLPAGTYEMHFERNGFGTLKQFGIQHLGGEPTMLRLNSGYYGAFFIYELPTTIITNLRVENDTIYCTFAFTKPEPDYLMMRLYFSDIDNFELSKAQFVKDYKTSNKKGIYSRKFFYSSLSYKSGERVFFRGCTSPDYNKYIYLNNNRNINGASTYFDYDKNMYVYPAIGSESEQFSFIVP